MELSYVTERIIALWFPEGGNVQSFRQGHHQAAHMLGTKHPENYMVRRKPGTPLVLFRVMTKIEVRHFKNNQGNIQ